MGSWTLVRFSLEEVRDGVATRLLPIIATMARALPEDENKALAAGCNGYLVKPLGPKEVSTRTDDMPFRPCPIPSGRWQEWRRFSRRLIRHALRVTT